MCLNTKIASGINSGTIIIAENNLECWESPEMKGAWGTHILTTDSHNRIQTDSALFYASQGAPPQLRLLWCTKNPSQVSKDSDPALNRH